MNCYIKYDNAGVQFVGKCVSGRPSNATQFAISPSYFDFITCNRIDKRRNEGVIDGWIKERMPELARENDNVSALMKMCVTSLVHYDGYLKEHLHENSMVRTPNFFTITIPLADFVTTKYLWGGTDDTPSITGIPPGSFCWQR